MMEGTEASASSARWAPAGGGPGAGIALSGRSGKEQQQGEHTLGNTSLTCDLGAGAGHGCVCRNHHPLYCLYPEVTGQQEPLPVTATLPLPEFDHTCWMRLCLAPASAPHKQQRRDVPNLHALVLIRGSSEAGREGDGERQKSASSKTVCTNGLAYK